MNWNRFRDILIDELSVEDLDGRMIKLLLLSTDNQLSTETYFRSYLWKILLSSSYNELYELPQKLLPPASSNDLAIENLELNHHGYSIYFKIYLPLDEKDEG